MGPRPRKRSAVFVPRQRMSSEGESRSGWEHSYGGEQVMPSVASRHTFSWNEDPDAAAHSDVSCSRRWSRIGGASSAPGASYWFSWYVTGRESRVASGCCGPRRQRKAGRSW